MPQDPDQQRRELFRLSGMGLEFGSAIMGGAALGFLLDWWLGSKPWLLLIGVALGFASGLFRIIRVMNQTNKPGRRPNSST